MDLLTDYSWKDEHKHHMGCYMKQADWDKNIQNEHTSWESNINTFDYVIS